MCTSRDISYIYFDIDWFHIFTILQIINWRSYFCKNSLWTSSCRVPMRYVLNPVRFQVIYSWFFVSLWVTINITTLLLSRMYHITTTPYSERHIWINLNKCIMNMEACRFLTTLFFNQIYPQRVTSDRVNDERFVGKNNNYFFIFFVKEQNVFNG